MEELDELKTIIKEATDELICETHPEVCRLRDQSYPNLEKLILDFVFKEEEPVSVQTAIAEIEQELTHI
ncbi:MAG: hypothetical protein AAF242_04815 [Bacteroidota bacterium]